MILNMKSFRKLIKKSHTFPTIAFLHYLKEQWEFCNEIFNIMLMSSELGLCSGDDASPPYLLVSVRWAPALLGDTV